MLHPLVTGRALLQYRSGAVAIACDGNSLTVGDLASSSAASYPSVLATLAPIATHSTPVVNLGVSGQTAAQMTSNRSDVSAAYVAGKINVLVAWEFVNSIYNGRTAQQAVDDLLGYVAAVKGDHPWRVAVMTAAPGYVNHLADGTLSQAGVDSFNADLDAANSALRAQWRLAADHLIELRPPGGRFAFADYLPATFDASGLFVPQAVTGGFWRLHMSDAGYSEVAHLVARGLRRMPVR